MPRVMALVALTLALALPASAQEPDGRDLVQARLVAQGSVVTAGSRVTLGVTYAIAPDWHIYWANPGDAGMPTSVELTLPEGWTHGPIRWPAPERHVTPEGPLVSYIYAGQVTLLIDVQVPANAKVGPVKLTGRSEWLVCQEACLPGDGALELALEVGLPGRVPAEPTPEAALISEAEQRMPRPAPPELRATWSGLELTLELPGASALAFLPLDPPDARDLARRGAAVGPKLVVAWPASARGKRITGVLEVRRGDRVEHVTLAVDAPP